MLYFSKIKIISIAIFTIIFAYLTTSNFLKFDDSFIDKKINLGLDLQGGSYLLLEIDNRPVITQKLQNKLSLLRNYFKNEDIKFRNLKIKDHKKMVESLKRGDRIITSGGIIGIVDRVMDNDRAEIVVGEDTKVEIIRSTGVQGLIKAEEPKK